MKTKKAQQEIIVTVLLVLIAIAAIVLISNFVINMVQQKTAQGTGQVACLGLDFTVNKAVNGANNVTITRGTKASDTEVIDAKLLIDGQVKNNSIITNWTTLQTVVAMSGTLTTGQKVAIAPMLKGGFICDPMSETVVTAN